MKRRIFKIINILGCLLVLIFGGGVLVVQDVNAQPDEAVATQQGQLSNDKRVVNSNKKRHFSIDKMPSLFFTYWQHQSIIDAKNSHGKVRPPTKEELEALEQGEDFKPDPGIRYISLGGIVYNSKDDWTIWINGKRVQPDAIPKEVLNLEVFKDYIEVKWHDEYTNRIFPLRLRSHQRFNMDMRIFLPG